MAARAELGGNRHEAGQDLLRHLDPRELLLARVWITDHGRHIETEVAHERKGMRRIYGQGRQDRKDGALEIVVYPLFLFIVKAAVIEQVDAVFGQRAFEVQAIVLLLLIEQRSQFSLNCFQLLQRGQSVVAEGGEPRLLLGLE